MQKELNLARNMKNNKGFFRHSGQKRQAKESMPLINNNGELALSDMEKAECLTSSPPRSSLPVGFPMPYFNKNRKLICFLVTTPNTVSDHRFSHHSFSAHKQ